MTNPTSQTAEFAVLPERPYAAAVTAVLRELRVEPASGLSAPEATRRLKQYGPNELLTHPPTTAARILVNQLKGAVVWLLATAAAVAALFGEWAEAIAILVVLAINTAIGFATELRAARSMEALRELGSRSSRVLRDGSLKVLPAEQVVPGDIVLLESGDVVTADIRLVEANTLYCDESTLTGESTSVEKGTAQVAGDAVVADRSSMVHKGTAITRGTAKGVVVATGMATELGLTTRLVIEMKPDASPLERKLQHLTGQLIRATLLVTALIAAAGIATGKPLMLMIEAGIALAVAAIPEGLPIVATMALARGMWRMAERNAVVERLAAVETLGATTVICTDKTGTLTENRMTAERLWLFSGSYRIDHTTGSILDAHDRAVEIDQALERAIEVGVLCSNATLQAGDANGTGDPMELALLRLGTLAGIHRQALLADWPELHELAFDAETKMMATAHLRDGNLFVAVKGAPEAVLSFALGVDADGRGGLSTEERKAWLAHAETIAEDGMRVLALAEKTVPVTAKPSYDALNFLGLVGFRDPPRAEVKGAIEACRLAGIRVIMVTGDHAVTARKIAEILGIIEPQAGILVEGRDLKPLNQIRKDERNHLLSAQIFARVTPAQKLDNVLAGGFAGPVDLLDLWRDKKRPSRKVRALAEHHKQAVVSRMEAHRSIIEVLSRLIAACKGDNRPDCPILDELSGERTRQP